MVIRPLLIPRLAAASFRHDLYVRGAMAEGGRAIAIVGARAASRKGMDRAHAIARHCGAVGIDVISGGALGIDGAAHRGALAGGGHTTVVLGSGVDIAYPKRHAPLFAEVLQRGGALVSILPPGTEPREFTFVQRNPLIAALADITIVVEATTRSGSLSTANATEKLGRLVCAFPGSPGCDRLLSRGAALVENVDDALAALDGTPRFPAPARTLDPIETQIVQAMTAGHTSIDAIVNITGLPVRVVLRALPLLRNS